MRPLGDGPVPVVGGVAPGEPHFATRARANRFYRLKSLARAPPKGETAALPRRVFGHGSVARLVPRNPPPTSAEPKRYLCRYVMQ
jgi:hypothetical protein